ncbi:MAG TPA: hypothetical protein PLD40_06565 [Kiritimatiellia bacterium]|jgi:hypothetical protein|nr:hypothetical protein [Kiritimatiellia bacterium]OQC59012.1 MAG: hypothetical protein BWX54_00828 [Verrucomicrobia bacterium ADurb.Bin018]MBP9572237.1 hypothetical protein [Kiritimatiellia bacterium]HOE00781.1 hypothetical protein [Kiritimatiellia bacterium]HOE37449.1 hypothetical protein [Kiritimatiellia bacterium]
MADAPKSKTLLGVRYDHYVLPDGADLYVTQHGRPFLQHLQPENWFEREWFRRSREKLQGTSTVYKVRTKPVAGQSKDLVVKWCRVGEAVPLDTFTLTKFSDAEFNTPYEEFSLVMEMRATADPGTIRTHKPLAIFVPSKRLELWQTGRSRSKIALKKSKFRDVELDIYRQYILIYEWIKGAACTEPAAIAAALESGYPDAQSLARDMLQRSIADMWQAGYRVLDVKPEHVIVRPRRGGGLLRDTSGRPAYALVDFELLARTPEHEEQVKGARRQTYLERQRDRFVAPADPALFPEHLRPMRILGVDYVYGDCASTRGKLWVVGRDPLLFDYFQPERWRRTPRSSLSDSAQVYHTKTKDGIELVWKVAHVGDPVDASQNPPALVEHGYNSPFEEFAYAFQLTAAGVPTTYPRAIYMLGHQSTLPPQFLDQRRYVSHQDILQPDNTPVLQRERNYICIWGYWNGLDEVLAREDRQRPHCRGVNAAQAFTQGLISSAEHAACVVKMARLLAAAGFESTNPRDTHFLLTLMPDGHLMRDPDGLPAVRLCNFEFLRPLAATKPTT